MPALRRRPGQPRTQWFASGFRKADAGFAEFLGVIDRLCVPLLRVSLGLVFVWFGALKLTWTTPVADLVAQTVPMLPADFLLTALGAFEVLIGLALLLGRWIRVAATLMIMHLGGTFLVLVTQPEVAFREGNPFLLTMTGEFVLKNLVLITAGMVLIGEELRRREPQEKG